MLKTYTVYLRDGRDGPSAFEPVLCRTPAEAMTLAREILARHPQCEGADVFFGGEELFRVKQSKEP